MDNIKYLRNKAIHAKAINNKWYILEPNKKIMRELNSVASLLWEMLEKPSTIEELVKRICKEFAVDKVQAEQDISVFIKQYLKEQLIQQL